MAEQTTDRTESKRVVWASLIGSVVEYYDFTLFGLAAALIFGKQFFPAGTAGAGTLEAFATFAVGFLARPVGGLVIGHFGDRVGRKPVMVATLLLMGISTFLIGVLPTYASVGALAPILLVVLRMLQGLGAGAEYAGAIVMVSETGETPRRGLRASMPGVGVFGGILLATAVFAAVSALPEAQFNSWGWRLPFFCSLVAVVVGLFMRARVRETPLFGAAKTAGKTQQIPVLEVIRRQPRNLIIAIASNGPFVAISYIIQVFLLSYATKTLGVPKGIGLAANLIASGLAIAAVPLFGALTDRIGRRPVWLGGAGFLVLFAFPMFALMNTRVSVFIVLAVVLGLAVGIASMYAAQAAMYAELFETQYRFSGVVLARESTAALIAGPAPFVAAALLQYFDASWPIALLVLVLALISFAAILVGPETRDVDLRQVEASIEGQEPPDLPNAALVTTTKKRG